jgi:hypothetical protein
VNESIGLNRSFADAAAKRPPGPDKPWSLVLGFGEFAPGNKLQFDNRHKTIVLSFSLLELGQGALCQGFGWFTAVRVRSLMVNQALTNFGLQEPPSPKWATSVGIIATYNKTWGWAVAARV